MSEFSRGSEWRRWDLHVHTASSYDYDYDGNDADELLSQILINNELAAVAITDHFIISRERIENLRRLAPDILFFPGVELRTDKGDTNIHVVLIFDSEINLNTLIEDFNVFRRSASNHGNNEKICWDYNSIVSFAEQHEALISIHAGRKANGVDDKISNALPHDQAVKEEYAKSVHIYEMGQARDLNEYISKVFPCIGERPMIICSDCHDPRNYNPKEKLWIKADLSFNGLKQIIYEPSERICVSEMKPEQKPAYLVIDRIELHDNDFQTKPIYFNDKLNCIIGGKSTGKSILLHNLALSLDRIQVEKKDETSQTRTKKDVEMAVYWADGKGGKDYPNGERKIIYVPQTYLNKLCDAQTERTEIDVIIQDIVLLNNDAKQAYDKTMLDIKNYKPEVGKIILDLLEIHRAIDEIITQMKELGDRLGIETEKEKLTKEKERLTKESLLTEEEVSTYENATLQITVLTREIREIDSELIAIDSIMSLVEPKRIDYQFSEQTKSTIDAAQKNIIIKSDEEWGQAKAELVAVLKENKKTKSEQLSRQQAVEMSLKDKIQSNKAISELTERIKCESEKLTKFEQYEKARGEKEQQKAALLYKAVGSMVFYKEQHISFSNTVNDNPDLKTEDLQFSVEVPFRNEAFIGKLNEIFNNRSSNFKALIKPEEFGDENYTEETLLNISKGILTEELPLKGSNTQESALRDIFDDWFEIKYKVTMGGDLIDVMSPGKKALVLLKLLIELAESSCPILIDQPEDDLDNRSVFDELILFIKKKKKDRQIIIVTHNANIVVGADAEEVIVANQRGNNAPNKDKRFEYRSGSIENDTPILKTDGTVDSGILNAQGIQQHICDILEGGPRAFELRKQKYHI